jgi:hypothetical protein
VTPCRAKCPPQPDLAATLEDRDHHDVRHTDRTDQECYRAEAQEETVQGGRGKLAAFGAVVVDRGGITVIV